MAAGLDSSRRRAMRMARLSMGAELPEPSGLAPAERLIWLFPAVSISVAGAELATFAVARRLPLGCSGKFRLARPWETISRPKEKTRRAAEPSILRC